MKPLQAASNSPSWRGLSLSKLSMSLRLNGTAALTNSGSSSDAKLVPLPANALPALLTARRLMEQPEPTTARPTNTNQTILCIAATDIGSDFRLEYMPARARSANR